MNNMGTQLQLFAFMNALMALENEGRKRPTIRALAERLGRPSSLALTHSLLELAETLGLVKSEYTVRGGRRVWFGSVQDWSEKLYRALIEE